MITVPGAYNDCSQYMKNYQHELIEFAINAGVLRFGDFTLKSGRTSPYFFNAGLFNTGAHLARLGRFYAQAITDSNTGFDVLFGPAYKGIPLAAATSIALADHHQRNVPWCFNRKETKDHGEGGNLVGSDLTGRILVIDDVITAGTAIRESVDIIQTAGANPSVRPKMTIMNLLFMRCLIKNSTATGWNQFRHSTRFQFFAVSF